MSAHSCLCVCPTHRNCFSTAAFISLAGPGSSDLTKSALTSIDSDKQTRASDQQTLVCNRRIEVQTTRFEQMQRKTVCTVILSLAGNTLPCFLGLLLLANTALSQTFDNFRFVGLPGATGGTVTSFSLDENPDGGSTSGDARIGELSYFDVAGLSSVFTLIARPSGVLGGQTAVYSSSDAGVERLQLADLHDIAFYTGELAHETISAPPNWFRLTYYRGTWSGVFRVGGQVYSLNRGNASDVVEVRTTLSQTMQLNPTLRTRLSAVFSTGYFQDDSTESSEKQIPSLESIHVLDGLLSDSLGLTFLLDQIIIDNGIDTVDLDTAVDWLRQNRDTYTMDDKLATVFFVDQQDANTAPGNTALVSADDAIILQPGTPEYQFATAHNLGNMLQLREQEGTLQHWSETGLTALPAVHLSREQQDDFNANPPASQLLQVLSNDQPSDDAPPLPRPPELDSTLVDSDSQERQAPGPQNDPGTASTTSGGGSAMWLLLVALVFFRQPAVLAR